MFDTCLYPYGKPYGVSRTDRWDTKSKRKRRSTKRKRLKNTYSRYVKGGGDLHFKEWLAGR